jgi:type 1 glutamine amidotransferase
MRLLPSTTTTLALMAVGGTLFGASAPAAGQAKIVLIAGRPSHGPGDHEFNAGTMILVDCLKRVKGVEPVMVRGGWPEDESVFDGAKSVVFYMDGGSGHPMIQTKERMALMKRLMDRGVGLVCLHYAVEFPKGEVGDQLLDWLGGYYETGYSTNPHNEALMGVRDRHPITRGVEPFIANDEWYYRIRFRPDDKRVTPILTTMLPKDRPSLETCAWATERADGGRAFGFTGAHVHRNWGINDFRKLVLNAILWTAKVEVPKEGVLSSITPEQLAANLDPKK